MKAKPMELQTRRKAQQHPKFLCDEMLKKLCRWMRIFGLDTEFAQRMEDEQVMLHAKAARRILLTMDETLYARCVKHGIPVYLVPKGETEGQLAVVIKRFAPKISFPKNTRCPKCNTMLLRIKKSEAKGRVYAGVYAKSKIFWRCPSCDKLYWDGTHWNRIEKAADRLLG